MPLLADAVGFGKPCRDLVVDLVRAFEPERVKMIPRRKSFDATKTRMFASARQNHVAIHPVLANHERRETHPHLECDSRFLWQNGDRTVLFRDGQQFVEDVADSLWFAGKMRRESVSTAGVGLIAIRKGAAATRTTPQEGQPLRRLHARSCRIRPAMSTRPHASAARPPAIRQTLKPSILTFLPVGSIPKKAPRCVPSETQ